MGSDRAPQSANNYNTTQLIKNSDDASRSDTQCSDAVTSSFLSRLLALLGGFCKDRSILSVTGNQEIDMQYLRQELQTVIVQQFKNSVDYEWNAGFSDPIHGNGLGFEPFDDFCSLFQVDPRTQISEYFEKNLEFAGLPLPLLSAIENDLLEIFTPYLQEKLWGGWNKAEFSKSYYDTSKSRPVWRRVDLVFLYIFIEAVDSRGETTPALLIRYIGGLYRLRPDNPPKEISS